MKVIKLSLIMACAALVFSSCSDELLEKKEFSVPYKSISTLTGEDEDDIIVVNAHVVNASGLPIPNVEVHVFDSGYFTFGTTSLQDSLLLNVPILGNYNYQLWQNGIMVRSDTIDVVSGFYHRLDTL